jgi:hypothetical protein
MLNKNQVAYQNDEEPAFSINYSIIFGYFDGNKEKAVQSFDATTLKTYHRPPPRFNLEWYRDLVPLRE